MTLQASFMGPQHAAIHKTNRQSRIALCLLSLSPWLPSIATPPHGAPSRPSLVFQIHRQSSKIAMQPSAVYDSLNIQGLRACCLRWECPDLWISRRVNQLTSLALFKMSSEARVRGGDLTCRPASNYLLKTQIWSTKKHMPQLDRGQWWWCLLSHCWHSGEPRMLCAAQWVWVHKFPRLGAFLCCWTLDRMSPRKALNPPGTNWIQVDTVRHITPAPPMPPVHVSTGLPYSSVTSTTQ